MTPLSVTELVEIINEALAPLSEMVVEGEVDEYAVIHQKWVTFKLKDADSTIGCFMPVWHLKTRIENGMLVRVQGRPTLRAKGFFSFVLTHVVPAGEGSLKRAFELLYQQLAQEGLFAPERKRLLPPLPQHIALITSRDAAAYSDFLKVLKGRMGGLMVSFLHTQVQGEVAPGQIIEALNYANTRLPAAEVIVLVRGGGSLEDLHVFNDERVVRAVAASRLPTLVGIGHERDITLAELAADQRASTPSNAAELVVPSRSELLETVQGLARRLQFRFQDEVTAKRARLDRSQYLLRQRFTRAEQLVRQSIERLRGYGSRFHTTVITVHHHIDSRTHLLRTLLNQQRELAARSLHELERTLQLVSPQAVLRRGYSITKTPAGRVIKHIAEAPVGETLVTQVVDGTVTSVVRHHEQHDNL